MQTACKLLYRILQSRHLSYRIKLEAFFHLTNTIVYPLMVVLTLLLFLALAMLVEAITALTRRDDDSSRPNAPIAALATSSGSI